MLAKHWLKVIDVGINPDIILSDKISWKELFDLLISNGNTPLMAFNNLSILIDYVDSSCIPTTFGEDYYRLIQNIHADNVCILNYIANMSRNTIWCDGAMKLHNRALKITIEPLGAVVDNESNNRNQQEMYSILSDLWGHLSDDWELNGTSSEVYKLGITSLISFLSSKYRATLQTQSMFRIYVQHRFPDAPIKITEHKLNELVIALFK